MVDAPNEERCLTAAGGTVMVSLSEDGMKATVHVTIENIKKTVPACRRCRLRSNEMLDDMHLPMLCKKCVGVIRDQYPQMVPLEEAGLERSRDCLWNHERECGCWAEGLTFPAEQP